MKVGLFENLVPPFLFKRCTSAAETLEVEAINEVEAIS